MKRKADEWSHPRCIAALALILGFSLATIETLQAEPFSSVNGALANGGVDARAGGYRGFFLPGIAPIPIAPTVECREGPSVSTGRFHERIDEDCARPTNASSTVSPGNSKSNVSDTTGSPDTRWPRQRHDNR